MHEGQVVLITGTSKGIGRELCAHALNQGARVIGFSRSAVEIENPAYRHFALDISDEEAVVTAFRRIRTEHGKVDVLINNAAIASSQFSVLMSMARAEEIMKINFLGNFLISRECARLMISQKFGRIIHLSSMMVPLAPVGGAIYSASKSALSQFSRVLAKELAEHNVTSNVLGISAMQTDMWKDLSAEKLKTMIDALPMKRTVTIADVANAIEFFARNESGSVTGQVLYLGGIS